MRFLALFLTTLFLSSTGFASTYFQCEVEPNNDTFINGYSYIIKENFYGVYLRHYTGSWIDCERLSEDGTNYAKCDDFRYPYKGQNTVFLGAKFNCGKIENP